jgi:agmatinase
MSTDSIPVGPTGNYFELAYADIPTFGKAPYTDLAVLGEVDVGVLGVPWDVTASPRAGARLGPRGIREESGFFYEVWDPQATPMSTVEGQDAQREERIEIADCGDARIFPFDIARTAASVRDAARTIASKTFPLVLGGDHYIMFPAYQGVCDAHPGATIGIVQIDAHDDTIDDDPVLGRHWCGSPIQRAIEHASLGAAAVAMVGLRGFIGKDLLDRHKNEGFTVIPMQEARELATAEVVQRAVNAVLEHCDVIYLTIDIDAADPSCAPGCSSHVPGGFLGHEFMALMDELGRYDEVIAMDLVEVAPPLDPTGQTPLFAATALFHYIDSRFMQL